LSNTELPPGWALLTLGDVAQWGSGGTPKSNVSRYYGGEIPWAVSGDLNDEAIRTTSSTITSDGLRDSSAKWVPEGAILIAMYGATIGKLGITAQPLTTNQAVAFAIPKIGLVDARFLFWYLRSQRDSLRKSGKGGAQPNISQAILKSWPIPVPPLPEQRRIVEALEEYISRLDAAIRLAQNASGRAKNLLPRLMGLHFSGDEVLRVRLDEIAEVRLGRQRSPKNHAGDQMRPYLRAANVGWNGLKLNDVKEMNFTDAELETYRLKANDIVLSEASGSPGEVGKPAIWCDNIQDCCFQNTLIRVRPTDVDPQYLLYFLRFEALRGAFREGSRGVGIHHLGAAKLAAWRVPLPSKSEQKRIVETLDSQTSDLAAARGIFIGRKSVAHASEALRKALLNRAVAGALVPRDPEDEPVALIIDRIRAEQQAKPKGKAARTSRPRRPAFSSGPTLPPATTPAPFHGSAVQQEFEL